MAEPVTKNVQRPLDILFLGHLKIILPSQIVWLGQVDQDGSDLLDKTSTEYLCVFFCQQRNSEQKK